MRRAILCVVSLAALAGCHREPTFDERYAAARAKIDTTAREIEAQASGSAVPTAEEDDVGAAK
ncbi:hypothetical protein EDF56_101685 [Novosphingobium sp. PhB165]|uniref:hypothetical protein n=1 Tax=Novosphingobium sp. PhB165 TaxID=2485105 RepID=UPI0010487F81|nr:hypothetical protein [Novosphingobium sp. PhB165]TCM22008.1 hypothetical protein EDF56_101685 [Novosphingobium sp. PhB165]